MPNKPVIWLSSNLRRECAEEATRYYDLETGGTLMGYWHGTQTAVVTAMIEAGPGALHERHSFEPDQEWQLQKIAEHYEASGRTETYLGDWHSHPNARSGRLSWTDRGVLRNIISEPKARAPYPIMIVFHGGKREWETTAWVAATRNRRLFWSKLVIDEVTLRLYEPTVNDD